MKEASDEKSVCVTWGSKPQAMEKSSPLKVDS